MKEFWKSWGNLIVLFATICWTGMAIYMREEMKTFVRDELKSYVRKDIWEASVNLRESEKKLILTDINNQLSAIRDELSAARQERIALGQKIDKVAERR